ncbi:Hypothetical protein A7982_05094 [Minicystis rosea]|nr:Hypothetical protein A7982_05094 [Minicystis rosea]
MGDMKPRLWSSLVLASSILAACGEVIVPDNGDTSTSDTSTGTSGGAGGQGAGGQGGGVDAGLPPECPLELAPPADCGDFAEACAGAIPIAGGGDTTYALSLTLDATHVYWYGSHGGLGVCGDIIYRTPKSGGPSARFAAAPGPQSFEVDDTALYVVEVGEKQALRAVDIGTGAVTHLGPIDPDGTDPDTYAAPYGITRTPGGVLVYGSGQWTPSFFRAAPAGVTPIATNVGAKGYLGSVPSFDGASLFFSWTPTEWDGERPLVRVGAGSTATTELAPSATSRLWPSVVVSDADVFFITGDPTVAFGNVEHPMGISRVAKTGGAPTILVPPGPVMIDQLLVDATDIYFSSSPLLPGGPPYSIQSVPRNGGTVRTVWSSNTHPDSLRQDADTLYFALPVTKNDSEVTGTGPGGLVVKVAKSTAVK